jgi:outer membrane protein TolC
MLWVILKPDSENRVQDPFTEFSENCGSLEPVISRFSRNLVLLGLLAISLLAQVPPQSAVLISLDLREAVRRAQAYNPQFLASGVGVSLAQEGRKQAKAALLPTASLLNQYVYTQANGTDSGIFIANNGIHEFAEQANGHVDLSMVKRAEYRRTLAAEATARARLDIAARGLIVTVAQNYYSLLLAQRRVLNAQRSLDEARRFETLTNQQEQGGEVAHADVVKAQLQRQQRERDALEAEINIEKSKIALAVLMFADLNQAFAITDDMLAGEVLPPGDEVRTLGTTNNPSVRAAESTVTETQYGIQAARGEYFPILSIDYFYGIDGNKFARQSYLGHNYLGSVVAASLTVPVWNWGATRSRVRTAELQRRQAEIDLRQTQRDVQAGLESLYLEASVSRAQIASLQTSVDTAAESLRLTNLRYQGGEATALEVVDAQTAATLARDAYDSGLARYRLAIVSLQANTGTF